jgi:protein-disulfide isomerase
MDDQSKKTTLWFIVGFIVLVVGGMIALGSYFGSSASPTQANFVATTVPAVNAADWKEGNANAAVTLIEYGDYECPACGQYSPIVEKLFADYGSRVLFVFRNFPLYAVHPDAQISAQAAEAAGLQGKYWQMNDLLYKDQATWSAVSPNSVAGQYFDGYAKTLGLDVAKFDSDMNASSVSQKIQTDVAGGNDAKIDHTPTFFVNLTQIPNPTSYDGFKKVLDAALASAPASPTTASSTGK